MQTILSNVGCGEERSRSFSYVFPLKYSHRRENKTKKCFCKVVCSSFQRITSMKAYALHISASNATHIPLVQFSRYMNHKVFSPIFKIQIHTKTAGKTFNSEEQQQRSKNDDERQTHTQTVAAYQIIARRLY